MLKPKIVLAGLATALLSSVAFAGFVQPAPVIVDTTARTATGDQVTARYSKNDVEFIGCGMRTTRTGAGIFTFGFCQATDAAGTNILCSTEDAELLDAISSSAAFSFITFSWNAADECTRIGFSNQSFYLPSKLDSNN